MGTSTFDTEGNPVMTIIIITISTGAWFLLQVFINCLFISFTQQTSKVLSLITTFWPMSSKYWHISFQKRHQKSCKSLMR